MSLTFIPSKLTPLVVTSLVDPVRIQSEHSFTKGLVTDTSGHYFFGMPPQNGAPYIIALNSQLISILNGGQVGTYTKANADPNFAATKSDILTEWTCTQDGEDISYDYGTIIDDIVSDLEGRRLLFGNASTTRTGSSDTGINFSHLVSWSSSTDDDSTDSFEVRAAWSMSFQGVMYNGTGTPINPEAADILGRHLNTMFMIQSGNNSLSSTSPASSPTQGCLVDATDVPLLIVFLVLIGFVKISILSLWWAGLKIRTWRRREQAKAVPYGWEEWMLQAGREQDIGRKHTDVLAYKPKDLKHWYFTMDHEIDVPHVVTKATREDALLK
ncbi:MAG: hypothetical protein M1820_010017 [Bogoriella megaspora]|nr:MAG: hypothetical protein M1820_010017 [Bogoriella megaspora]